MNMQRNTGVKYIVLLMSSVLAIIFLLAATVHIIISFFSAIIKHHIYYFNPIRILGINNFWPKYQNSDMATLISWGILISLYFVALYFYIRRFDPDLVARMKSNVSYNKETKQLIYETRNATEIEVVPLTKLITQAYKLKDLLYRVVA